MSTTTRRVFVGGLAPSVTEGELTDRFQRFGQVSNLQLKSKTVKDMPTRTFAHMDLTGQPSKLTQCMSAYNNCQWKGHRMTIQWAKDNFLDKLKTEVAERKKPKEKVKVEESPPKRRVVAGAKPGQPVPGEKESDWVVAKFGMALPVLNHKSKDNRRVMKIDPSKFTHCLKRMKDGDGDVCNDVSKLTWAVDGDSKLAKLQEKASRKRKIVPKVTKTVRNGETNNTFEDGMPHTKIAKLKLAEKCHFENEKKDNIEASSDSEDDSQVFSRRKPDKILNTGSNLKGNEVAKYSIKGAKTQSPGMKVTIRKDTRVKYDSESEPDSDDSFTVCKKAKTDPLSSNLNPSPISPTNPQSTTPHPSSTKKTVSAESASSSKTNSTNQRRTSGMTPLPVISFLSDGESDDSRGSGDTDEIIRQGKKRESTPIVLKHGKVVQVSEFGSGLAKMENKAKTQTIRERVNVPDKLKAKPEMKEKSESEESSSDESETNKTASSPSNKVSKGSAISTMTLVEDSQLSTSASSPFSDGNEMDKSADEDTDSSDSEDEAAALNKSSLTAPKHVVETSSQQLKSKQATHESEQVETSSSDDSSEETDDGESEEQTPTPAGPGKVKVKVKVSAESTVAESTSSEESSGNSEEIESVKSSSATGSREHLSEEPKSDSSKSEVSSSSPESSQDESESELKPVSPQKNVIKSATKPAMDSESVSSSNEDSGDEFEESDSYDSSKQPSQSVTFLKPTTKAVEAEEEDSTDSEDESEEYDESGAEDVAESSRQDAKDFFNTSSEEETDTSAEVVEKVTELIEKAKIASMNSDITTTKVTLETNKNEKKLSADKSSSLTETTKTAPDSTTPETDLKAEDVKAGDGTLEATKTKKKEKKEKQTVEGAKPQTKLEKHKSDNEKRLESVRQKEAAVKSQKRAVQEALAKLDAGGSSMNKKIKFDSDSDDDEDEEIPASTKVQNVAKGATLPEKSELSKGSRSGLFSGSSGSDDEDSDSNYRFRIRPQFQGKDGQKLMKLQSSYKDDARFKLDDRFVDPDAQSDDQSEEEEEEEEEEEAKNDLSEEKQRNLKILEAVVGKSVASVGQKPKAAFKEAVRYDPTKDDHQEYLVKEKNEDKKKKKKEKAPSKSVEDSPVPAVSKDTFYAVETDMLKSVIVDKKANSEESTKKPGAVFNFFFDDDDDLQIDDEKDDDSRIEATSTSSSKSNVFLGEKNPFKYDSSSESESEQDMDDVTAPSDDVSGDVKAPKTEPFFFMEDDPRIKEGIETFHAHEDPDEVRRKWLERREGLIELYKSLKRKRRAYNRVNLSRNQSKRGGHKAR